MRMSADEGMGTLTLALSSFLITSGLIVAGFSLSGRKEPSRPEPQMSAASVVAPVVSVAPAAVAELKKINAAQSPAVEQKPGEPLRPVVARGSDAGAPARIIRPPQDAESVRVAKPAVSKPTKRVKRPRQAKTKLPWPLYKLF
jgi:hypothetical protein